MVQPLRLPLCPRCQQALARERVTCRSCGAAHHPECWVQGRGCGFYACGGSPAVTPPPGPVPVRALARAPAGEGPVPAIVGPGLAAAAACILFGLAAWFAREPGPPLTAPPEEPPALCLQPAASSLQPPGIYVHDLRVDQTGTTAVIAWDAQRPYDPAFRWGRDGLDTDARVERTEVGAVTRTYRVKLERLQPGVEYGYRVSGFPGGPVAGRFTALPPAEPRPVSLSTGLLDFPDGATAIPATFGRDRRARPLWLRSTGTATAAAAAAPGRLVVHDGRHLQALDLTDARPLWTHPMPAVACAPVVAGDLAIAATPDGAQAFDLATGRPRWRLPLPAICALHLASGDVHVQVAGGAPRLIRVQVADGLVVSVVPLPLGLRELAVADAHIVLLLDESPASRDAIVRVLDRLRGERRWERLLAGRDLPELPLRARAGRLWLAYADRVEARALADGEELAERPLDEPPALLLALEDGGALVATAGAGAHALALDRSLAPRRAWTLPAAPHRGAATRHRAALADGDGIQILELDEGPRWGVAGLPPLSAVHLTEDGCLVAEWSTPTGLQASAQNLLALGLR